MKIINPLYDNAFKYLMDNERIAKLVLSIILDRQVISLQSKPQETSNIAVGNINLMRFDYKAVISTENGEYSTVLIEVQKYRNIDPVSRFRKYLAKNYIKEETIINKEGEEETAHLPIITIYILGFDLPEFPGRSYRVDNNIFDLDEKKYVDIRSSFVELITHQSYILIAATKENIKIRNTRLAKFLNLFIQKLKSEESNTVIDLMDEKTEDIELQEIVSHLQEALFDEELLLKLQAEKEYAEGMANLEEAAIKAINEKTEALKEKAEAQKREAEAQQREAEAQKEKAEAQQREAEAQKEKAAALLKIEMMIKSLHLAGMSIEQISLITGETVETIQKILS